MRILALYIKEIDYKKIGKKKVEINKINFTDKRIVRTLKELGHSVAMMEYDKNKLPSVKGKFDLIFNLADGLENDNDFQEITILENIEKLNIPYTGNSSKAIKACYDKSNIKKTLLNKGISTPNFQVIAKKEQKLKSGMKFPVIIKPLFTDGGVGITDKSVVYDNKQFQKQLKKCIIENNQPVLVEEYIDGRDFCVPVIGGRALSPVECTFSKKVFANRPKILTYTVKWDASSEEYNHLNTIIRNKFNRNFSSSLDKSIKIASEKTFKVMGCTSYATVDIRVDKNNKVFVIEINPNCWIDKNSDSAKVAKIQGIDYPAFISTIINLSKKSIKK